MSTHTLSDETKTGPSVSKGKGKRILVTGGAGFIGTHTVIELVQAGYEIEVVDNLVNADPEGLRRVCEIVGKQIPLHLIDLTNKAALNTLFDKSRPFHAVIHFAGLKAVGESVQKPLLYYDNNIIGTINLLHVMEAHNCFNLVFSSSATVYGVNAPPVDETASLSATNAYGRTKLFIEGILRDLGKGSTGSKWRVAILRYFNPVGAHESGRIGEDPGGIPNNLMPYVSQVAVGRRPFLSVFGSDYDTPDGTGQRDYIHVVDLARGHVAALNEAIYGEALSEENNVSAFNLGTGNGVSVLELVKAMEKASGKKIPYKIVERRAGDVAKNWANADKANKQLKWTAKFDVERMCADTWRWQSQNPLGFAKGASE